MLSSSDKITMKRYTEICAIVFVKQVMAGAGRILNFR
jgi:hypothetical protein